MFNLPHYGIDIELFKEPALSRGIFRINRPITAFVPLRVGSKDFSLCALHAGDKLKKGQKLAVSEDGTELVSPYAGTFIGTAEKKHPLYRKTLCAQIETEESVEKENLGAADVSLLPPEDIIAAAARALIVDELDGRLLSEKLSVLRRFPCSTVAVSSCDTQPYVSSGSAVLAEYGTEVSGGAELISAVSGGSRKYILVYGEECAEKAGKSIGGTDVMGLTGQYPFLPPFSGDTFYVGVQAARALYNACARSAVQDKTVITVSGGAVEYPLNIEASIGTPVIELIGHCGFSKKPGKIAANGVMSGTAISPASVVYPGLVSLTLTEKTQPAAASECIGCGRCVRVCPADVAPCYTLRDYLAGRAGGAGFRRAVKCIDCGLCSYICPSGIDLRKIVRRSAGILEKFKKNGGADHENA